MVNWEKFNLTDIPFLAIPQVRISSEDKRVNGKLYYDKFAQKQFERMLKISSSDMLPIVFLRSEGSMLGNGKSVFLANIYWSLKAKKRNVVWSRAPLEPNIRQLLANILDSLVTHKIFSELKKKITKPTTRKLENLLKKYGETYGSSTLYSLNQLLQADEHELTRIYSNIKRRIPTQDYIPLFGAFFNLCYAAKFTRIIIFIDQFEDFIRKHRSISSKRELGLNFNRLLRNVGETTTFIVSLHSEAEDILLRSNPDIETFLNVSQSIIDLPDMKVSHILGMVKLYLEKYRKNPKLKSTFYPFIENVVKYTAHRASMNPRRVILALRAALFAASIYEVNVIDIKFVNKYHDEIFGGYENKVEDFLEGKWTYTSIR